MGTTDRGIYLPADGEVAWGDEVNLNFNRLADTGINVKAYGAVGDGTTDDTAAIQAAITAAGVGGMVYFPSTTTSFKITADLEVTTACTLTGPGKVKQATAGQAGFTVSASNVVFRGMTIEGPQSSTYNAAEKAISFAGTSAASPMSDVRVEDCRLYSWGRSAIEAKWANRCHFNRNTIQDIVYAGVLCLSCIQGEANSNIISDIHPGTASNCYGLTLTREPTNSITDDPRCTDWTVNSNTVRDIPVWEALDTHGGQRIVYSNNTIYNCLLGIVVGSSNNASAVATWAALDVTVNGNVMDSAVTDGSAQAGIAFTGAGGSVGTPVETSTGTIVGNTVKGYGTQSSAISGGILVRDTESLTITGNHIWNPSPIGINVYHDNYGFTCTGNTVIDAWSDTGGVGAAWGLRVSSTYNFGVVSGNAWRNGSLAGKTYILTRGIDMGSGAANNDVTIGPNFSEATADVLDTNALSTAKDYAVTNLVTDRALDCNANDDLATADVLGTLISDLITLGVLR